MLAGKRAIRVGDQILREIAILLMENVNDPRVKGTTITGVNLSNDLRHAKVFYSVMGDDEDIKRAQAGLDSAKGFIKRHIGLRLKLRYIPDIIFKYDPSIKEGRRLEQLLSELKSGYSMD